MHLSQPKEEVAKLVAKVVAHAWLDPAYKECLVLDPVQTFRDAGIEVEEGVDIVVLQDTEKTKHLVLSDERVPEEHRVEQVPYRPNFQVVYARAYHQSQEDPEFRRKFLFDPKQTFFELGYPVPDEVELAVYENEPDRHYFPLPLAPAAHVSTEALQRETAMLISNVNANANVNVNGNTNVNGDVNVNGGVQVNVAIDVNVLI